MPNENELNQGAVAGEPFEHGAHASAALREHVRDFAQTFSIEVTPQGAWKVPSYGDLLPQRTEVYVPHLPDVPLSDAIAALTRLSQEGMVPVAHIAARNLTSEEELKSFLEQATGEAGLSKVLLIGGGVGKQRGPFGGTFEVLDTGLLDEHGISAFGIAGHPEGSPDISNTEIRDSMKAKVGHARKSGAQSHIVTQFFFDATPVIDWEAGLRNDGFDLPIHIGLHGVTSFKNLMWYGMQCGIGNSLRVLAKQKGRLTKLATVQDPGKLLLEIVRCRAMSPQSLFASPHFFPLGGFEATAKWIGAIRSGEFEIHQDGQSLLVE